MNNNHSSPGARKSKRPAIFRPQDYKIVSLRECAPVNEQNLCDDSSLAFKYWLTNVQTSPYFNPDCECLVAILLDSRRRAKGHAVVSVGLLDTVIYHARELFRSAIIGAASAVIVAHNHPAGDPSPSPADVKVTSEIRDAGNILKIEVLDHIIIGGGQYFSFYDRGYLTPERPKWSRAGKACVQTAGRGGIITVQT